MTIAAIREKLHDFVNTADDKQVETLYSIFEDEIAEKYDWWKDEGFLKELKCRLDDIESCKVQGISWEVVKLKARDRLAAKNRKS
jgi:hypothetical protein